MIKFHRASIYSLVEFGVAGLVFFNPCGHFCNNTEELCCVCEGLARSKWCHLCKPKKSRSRKPA